MKIYFTVLITLIIFFVKPIKAQQKSLSYLFETEKIFTKGKCPDSIRASVYDVVAKKKIVLQF
jgi:hypothetical protein